MTMSHVTTVAAAGVSLWLVGCASAPTVTVREPVGPTPAESVGLVSDGQLQVYSARERAPIDLNKEEFLWNNDFGWNEFLYEPAHTAYNIYASNGSLVQHVPNARAWNDAQPTLVTLGAGSYRIEAEAEAGNGMTLPAEIPVVVKGGHTTLVRLDQDWHPTTKPIDGRALVQADDGRFVGWRVRTEGVAHSQ